MFWWPGQRLKIFKCQGKPVQVFRFPQDAFPIYVQETSSALNAAISALEEVKANFETKHATTIRQIRSQLDDANRATWDHFYSCYMTFFINPCGEAENFGREIRKLRDREYHLRVVVKTLEKLGGLKKAGVSDTVIQSMLDKAFRVLTTDEGQSATMPGWERANRVIERARQPVN